MPETRIIEEIKYLRTLAIHDYSDMIRLHTKTARVADELYGAGSHESLSVVDFKEFYGHDARGGDDQALSSWIRALQGFLDDFLAAIEKGWLSHIRVRAQGEILGDLIVLAKQHLTANQTEVAGVLAGAALEEAFKRCALKHNPSITGSLSATAGYLNRSGLLVGAEKSMVDSLLALRNKAMHADWKEITPAHVASAIAFLEQFLLKHFS